MRSCECVPFKIFSKNNILSKKKKKTKKKNKEKKMKKKNKEKNVHFINNDKLLCIELLRVWDQLLRLYNAQGTL